MNEQDDREFETLKRDYAGLRKHEPGEPVDAAIRAAARRHAPQRRLRIWSAALASAACVGLAFVLVPALLVEAPDPGQQPQAELMIRVANEEAERRSRAESAAQKARETHRANAFAAVPPPSASPAPAKKRTAPTPTEDAAEDAYVPEVPMNPDDELRALYEELAAADEPAWRRRLLELRAAGREPLAAAALNGFRARFDRPASFNLDDLAREEARAQERR